MERTSEDAHAGEITLLIRAAREGSSDAANDLFRRLLADLRETAGRMMRNERSDHTLQPTAVINEACLRLLEQNVLQSADNRRYLFSAANRAMRRILVDYARQRNSRRRGGDRKRESLEVILDNFEAQNGIRFPDLDAALAELEQDSPRQREVVEHRYFGGLSIAETAELLGVTVGTVERDWRLARAKLYAALRRSDR